MTQVTVMTGPERRRRWDDDVRNEILASAFSPRAVVAEVARRFSERADFLKLVEINLIFLNRSLSDI
jgi:transposase-like protein